MSLHSIIGDRKFVASFSGGKDSTLSTYRALKAGGTLAGLITTLSKERMSSYSHCITRDHLIKLASHMNTTVHLIETDSERYRQDFVDCLRSYRSTGVEAAIFGDIDLEGHREWVESVCNDAGITAVFPLWQADRKTVVREFIQLGFRAVIKVVSLAHLDTSFLGRILNEELLEEFAEKGIDVCGENGEYHTLVFDGPLFEEPFLYEVEKIVEENGYGILMIK